MDKSSDESRGGFGMRKSKSRGRKEDPGSGTEKINGYLEIEQDSGIYDVFYTSGSVREEVAEVSLSGNIDVELSGEGFSDADYQLFLEEAGFYLEEQGEIENPYRLLEEV